MAALSLPKARRTGGDDYTSLDTDELRPGTVLFAAIYDERGTLLLADGQTVTDGFLEKLRERKMRSVRVHDRDAVRFRVQAEDQVAAGELCVPQGTAEDAPEVRQGQVCAARNESSDRLDAEICLGRVGLPQQGEPLLNSVAAKGATSYDPADKERLDDSYVTSIKKMSDIYGRLGSGGGLDPQAMEELAESAAANITPDIDLFSAVAGNPLTGGYPVRHSIHSSMLAMAVGVRLKLDAPTLRELVIGCLVHDAGMLRLANPVHERPEELDAITFLEIMKHPVLVFDALKEMGTIPKRSAFIAYQMHERCDGSGYPRRRSGNQIHFLSKVAAVADAYVALVSPRPHRPAMMPYFAMERILRDAKRGLFDRDAVRGLLRTLSLFPIGSYVELSDGRRGRVLRAGEDYCRPMIEVGDAASGTAKVVDLVAEKKLSVVKAIPAL